MNTLMQTLVAVPASDTTRYDVEFGGECTCSKLFFVCGMSISEHVK